MYKKGKSHNRPVPQHTCLLPSWGWEQKAPLGRPTLHREQQLPQHPNCLPEV